MIVCHPLKLIFIKTKKVGGTSFEIALSKYCEADCIITPILPEDEAIRNARGFRGAQNARWWNRRGFWSPKSPNYRLTGNFSNHDSAAHLRKHLGPTRFGAYLKVSIQRNPLDFLISQYFYRFRETPSEQRPPFKDWVLAHRSNVFENQRIAPSTGEAACDVLLRYEHLRADLEKIPELPADFGSLFESLSAKGGIRPAESREARGFFEAEGLDPDALLRDLNHEG